MSSILNALRGQVPLLAADPSPAEDNAEMFLNAGISAPLSSVLGSLSKSTFKSPRDFGLESDRYDKDPTFADGPDDTWEPRLWFQPNEEEDAWYVVYAKMAEKPAGESDHYGHATGWGDENVADYLVLYYYDNTKDFDDDNYEKGVLLARTQINFDREFQFKYLTERVGDLDETTWNLFEAAVEANGHTINEETLFDWDESEDDEDAGLDPQVIALREQAAKLRHQINDLLSRTGLDSDDPEYEELLADAPSESDILRAKAEPKLREYVSLLKDRVQEITRQYPTRVEEDEVEVLPPGSEMVPKRTEHSDHGARKPTQDTGHTLYRSDSKEVISDGEVGSKTPSSTVPEDPEDRLRDISADMKVSKGGKQIEIELPNGMEFTIVRRGRKPNYSYEVTHDTWMTEDEYLELVDAFEGETTKNGKKLKRGWGKKFVRFNYDKSEDAWEMTVEGTLTFEQAAELIERTSKVNTDMEGTGTPERGSKDWDIFKGIEVVSPDDIVTPTASPEGEEEGYSSFLDADDWHAALDEAGFEQTSRLRYVTRGKEGKQLIIKLEPMDDADLAHEGFKKAVVLHGKKKVREINNTDELVAALHLYLPDAHTDDSVEHGDSIVDEDGTEHDADFTLVDTVYIIEMDTINFITIDGDEADASWLSGHGFVWHPPQWWLTFRSKSKALNRLDLLKARGIEIENEDELVRLLSGRKPQRRKRYSEILRKQREEKRRKPNDMRFSGHLTEFEGDKVLLFTDRNNNRKARQAFKRARFTPESAGYWLPVDKKTTARKVLKALHKDGLRLGDPEQLEDAWEDVFGGKLKIDFSA